MTDGRATAPSYEARSGGLLGCEQSNNVGKDNPAPLGIPPHRAWSEAHLGCTSELQRSQRALAFASGQHARIGNYCALFGLDADLVRIIYEMSEIRACVFLECGGPHPGCSLYGFMFDVQKSPSQSPSKLPPTLPSTTLSITALQIFSSNPDCDDYSVYYSNGTWRKKDGRHLPGSKHSDADNSKWHRLSCTPNLHSCMLGNPLENHTTFTSIWLVLEEPIYVHDSSTVAIYVHCPTAWGAIAYRMLDDTGCQVAPGSLTSGDKCLRLLTGTCTESPHPFEDVNGCVCAFAGRVEYDVLPFCCNQARASGESNASSVRGGARQIFTQAQQAQEQVAWRCRDCRWHDGVRFFDCGQHVNA
jgi:hypothetical protein